MCSRFDSRSKRNAARYSVYDEDIDAMPTICLQCSMRALVNGEPSPTFEETPTEHMARVHPDPLQTQRERIEVERALRQKLILNPTFFTK